MKRNPTLFLMVVSALPFAGNAGAQAQQTAEGAQKFLATMIGRGGAVDAVFHDASGRGNWLKGTKVFKTYRLDSPNGNPVALVDSRQEEVEMPLDYWLDVHRLDAVAADGSADVCTTRISDLKINKPEQLGDKLEGSDYKAYTEKEETFFGFKHKYFRDEWSWKYEDPLVKFGAPHYIDWRKAKVSRSNEGKSVFVASPGQPYAVTLRFRPDDAELLDRIEFAMKFLQASCDAAADTGF